MLREYCPNLIYSIYIAYITGDNRAKPHAAVGGLARLYRIALLVMGLWDIAYTIRDSITGNLLMAANPE